MEGFGDNTWVDVGDHRSMVGIVRINIVTHATKRQECGFKYIEYVVGEVIDTLDTTVNNIEAIMER